MDPSDPVHPWMPVNVAKQHYHGSIRWTCPNNWQTHTPDVGCSLKLKLHHAATYTMYAVDVSNW
eukprot:10348663-Lingulodinium_polyedra.AAC.1